MTYMNQLITKDNSYHYLIGPNHQLNNIKLTILEHKKFSCESFIININDSKINIVNQNRYSDIILHDDFNISYHPNKMFDLANKLECGIYDVPILIDCVIIYIKANIDIKSKLITLFDKTSKVSINHLIIFDMIGHKTKHDDIHHVNQYLRENNKGKINFINLFE